MTQRSPTHPEVSENGSVDLRCRFSAPATPLPHHWEACVGSGHAALCVRADWQRQIERAHEDLGFERVRFHGLLSGDVGTLVEVAGKLIYAVNPSLTISPTPCASATTSSRGCNDRSRRGRPPNPRRDRSCSRSTARGARFIVLVGG